MSNWKVIHQQEQQTGRFNVQKDRILLPTGKEIDFSFIKFSDGVCVLPILAENVYIAINQYRHPVGKRQWEFPAGMIETGEMPLQTAQKELLEETGYEAKEWISLGTFHPSAGSTSEKIHLFAARNLVKHELNLEETEDIFIEALEEKKLLTLIENDEFQHGGGMAIFLKYQIWLKNKHD